MQLTIQGLPDPGLPRADTPEVYKQRCAALLEHFYEAYTDDGTTPYAA